MTIKEFGEEFSKAVRALEEYFKENPQKYPDHVPPWVYFIEGYLESALREKGVLDE